MGSIELVRTKLVYEDGTPLEDKFVYMDILGDEGEYLHLYITNSSGDLMPHEDDPHSASILAGNYYVYILDGPPGEATPNMAPDGTVLFNEIEPNIYRLASGVDLEKSFITVVQGESTVKRLEKAFVMLFGGPCKYDGKDKANDKKWESFIKPILDEARNGELFSEEEEIYWLVYAPAYERRWEHDRKRPGVFKKYIYDRDMAKARFEHTKDVIEDGAENYIDYIIRSAAELNEDLGINIEVREITAPDEFWDFLWDLPGVINRVWYFGHAREDLWLTLEHDDHVAVAPDREEFAVIPLGDIDDNQRVKEKFSDLGHPSKFYGCDTDAFADRWNNIFGVAAQGAGGSISFDEDNLQDIENSAEDGWQEFS
jgi:hypothetical protein